MATTRHLLSSAGLLVVGSISGVVSTLLLSPRVPQQADHIHHLSPPSAESAVFSRPSVGPGVNEQVNALEARLARLEVERAQINSPTRSTPSGEETSTDSPSPEMEEQMHLEQHRKLLESHRTEDMDVAWARPSRTMLVDELSRLQEGKGVKVTDVDCRATTCTVEMEWDSLAQAQASLQELVTHEYGLNCGRTMTLEPSDGRTSYHSTMVFMCDRQPARL